MEFAISQAEYKQRVERVRKALAKRKLDALYLTHGTSMFYLTGYSFISTERPAALVIPLDGTITFLGPLLEKDHVPLETTIIKDVKTYTDYPGTKHPIEHFAQFLTEMKLTKKRIGTDSKVGALSLWGYKGPPLTKKLKGTKFVEISDLIWSMRLTKSPAEIQLIRESSKWANLAVSLMQKHAREGTWDVEAELKAATEASTTMKKTLGTEYTPKRSIYPVSTAFRGQIGEMSAIPHAMATKHMIKKGDVIIAETGVDIGGYTCELERTMIVGQPTEKQRKYFNAMLEAQDAAFNAFKPGAKCSDIDKASIKAFKKADLISLVKHHTGHGLGLEGHEPPWLDVGNQDPLRPGMVVSCEPGIYERGYAGFRHSDTVLVTEDGMELLTQYSRNIDELTISTSTQ
jgi:Xaa-Pro aminopeptidase